MVPYRHWADSFYKKLIAVANNLSNILLPDLKSLSDISQAISLQKCLQIADIYSLFLLHKCLLPKCNKKVSKSVETSRQLHVQSSNILLTHTKRTKMLVHFFFSCRLKTTINLSVFFIFSLFCVELWGNPMQNCKKNFILRLILVIFTL
jgi:hypothetical protein